MSRFRSPLLLLAAAVVVGGCGAPDRVTYVDPNPDSAYAASGVGGTTEPFVTHGNDAALAATAVLRLRGAILLAGSLEATEPAAAREIVGAARDSDFATIEPVLELRAPEVAAQVRTAITRLADRPPTDAASYTRAVSTLTTGLLDQAWNIVVPVEASQDPGFRAAALASSLTDAALDYESALVADPENPDTEAYRRAYAAVLDARTKGLVAVSTQTRAGIADRLAEVLSTAFTSPAPTAEQREPEAVTDALTTIADDIAVAAHIDTVAPVPDASTPDQLRSVKRSVASALETLERGERDTALTQLSAAAIDVMLPAGRGLAAVDGALLVRIERILVLDLPAAIRGGNDAAGVATELDSSLDEAISSVEAELELQREAS